MRGNRITLTGEPGEVALAERMLDELVAAFDRLAADPPAAVVVVAVQERPARRSWWHRRDAG